MYQSTSYEAWQGIQEKLGDKQKIVLWAFRSQGDMTNAEMAEFLNWPINSTVPRVHELRGKGLVGSKGSKIGKSGTRCIIWGVV